MGTRTLMPTSLYPLRSKRAMISAIKLRWTPSGFTMMKERSFLGLDAAAAPALQGIMCRRWSAPHKRWHT